MQRRLLAAIAFRLANLGQAWTEFWLDVSAYADGIRSWAEIRGRRRDHSGGTAERKN
jgi:hypothetical protein